MLRHAEALIANSQAFRARTRCCSQCLHWCHPADFRSSFHHRNIQYLGEWYGKVLSETCSVRVRSIWSLLSLPCLPSPGCLQPERHVEGLKVSSGKAWNETARDFLDLNFSTQFFPSMEFPFQYPPVCYQDVSRCIKLEVQVSSSNILGRAWTVEMGKPKLSEPRDLGWHPNLRRPKAARQQNAAVAEPRTCLSVYADEFEELRAINNQMLLRMVYFSLRWGLVFGDWYWLLRNRWSNASDESLYLIISNFDSGPLPTREIHHMRQASKWVSHGVTNTDKCGFPLPGSVHSCAHPSACYANWHELWAPQPCRDEPSPVRSPLPEKSAVLEPSVLCKSISKRRSRWFDMTGAIVSWVPLYDFHTFTFTNILAPCQSGSRPFPRWSCHSRSPIDQLWQSMCNVPQCDIQPGCRCGSLLPTGRANGKIIAFFWFLCF